MKNSNWLAESLEWYQKVIEAAETPFAKLAIFILPVLSPIVPAFFTALHVYKLTKVIFEGNSLISWVLSVLVGIVLELIGYVGVISVVQNIYQWIKTRKEEFVVPALLNGLAYIFYLVAMWKINFELGEYFETPRIVNSIVGLLSFITIPTGLLAASHLSQKMQRDEDKILRQEKYDFQLKKQALQNGVSQPVPLSFDAHGVSRPLLDVVCENPKCARNGKPFQTRFPNKKTCSDACRQALHRARKVA